MSKAVEGPADARAPLWVEFKQTIAEGARVRQAKARPMLAKKFDESSVVREDVHWPGLNLGEYPLVEVLDLERHRPMLANPLTWRKSYSHDV